MKCSKCGSTLIEKSQNNSNQNGTYKEVWNECPNFTLPYAKYDAYHDHFGHDKSETFLVGFKPVIGEEMEMLTDYYEKLT